MIALLKRLDVERCYACGDEQCARFDGRMVCRECFDELMFGIIRNQNIHFIGNDVHPPLDDIGPWQENAIRILEGDHCFSSID